MDNSSNTVLTKKSYSLSQNHLPFDPSGSHLFYYVIKNTPSDVESCKEQDGNKKKFVEETTAKLWPDFTKL